MRSVARYLMLALIGTAGCATQPRGAVAAATAVDRVRVVTPLSRGWRFNLGQPAGGDPAQAAFEDGAWQRVDAPHTWNSLGEYRVGRTAATRSVQGIGWYRRELDSATLPPRARHWLQFDAVGNVADVWVNGVHVGRHAGAFSRFRFDITDQLRPARNDYLWGSWIWNMFDFSSTVRQEGDANDINDKGLVSFDRKVRKDAFYYFKAQWSDAAVVHFNGRRYVRRAYPVTHVRVYSNAQRVSLSRNGAAIGDARCVQRVCVFAGVKLDAGANRLVARARFPTDALEDALDWQAPDARDGIAINSGDLSQVTTAGRLYGGDAFFVGGQAKRLAPERESSPQGRADAALLAGYRTGAFAYDLPLPPGRWRIALVSMAPEPDAPRLPFHARAGGSSRPITIVPGSFGQPVTQHVEATSVGGNVHVELDGPALVSALVATPVP